MQVDPVQQAAADWRALRQIIDVDWDNLHVRTHVAWWLLHAELEDAS